MKKILLVEKDRSRAQQYKESLLRQREFENATIVHVSTREEARCAFEAPRHGYTHCCIAGEMMSIEKARVQVQRPV